MPLNSAGKAAHSANANWCLIAAQPVSFKFVTLKRKRASIFPYSCVSQWKGVFRVFLNEMNCTLLVSVLRLLNIPSLVIFTSGDWRKLQYSNHFKSWQSYQLKILMMRTRFRIRVWHLLEEKRYLPYAKSNYRLPSALRPENKQRVTLKLSGKGCHLLSVI